MVFTSLTVNDKVTELICKVVFLLLNRKEFAAMMPMN